MSNLPVLWVPPVTPPSPEDRPPRNRRTRVLLIAAAALIATPIAAVALLGSSLKTAPVAEGPSTSGGNQPSTATPVTAQQPATATAPVAAPTAPAAPAKPARAASTPAVVPPAAPVAEAPRAPTPAETAAATPAPTAPAPATVGAEGQPVRVIDMGRRPDGDAPTTVVRPEAGTKAAAEPAKPAPAPGTAAPQPATASAPPAAPAAPQAMRPAVDPAPAKPATAAVAPSEAPVAVPVPVPLPEKKPVVRDTTAPRPKVAAQPPADARSRDDFPDRLAAIRRSENRRAIESEAAIVDDEEEVIVVPRRHRGWGFLPPLFGSDEPPRPALRSFDPPGRVVRNREGLAANCHYHAYPADGMNFHRDVRCHWHSDPNDPSLRYVQPVER